MKSEHYIIYIIYSHIATKSSIVLKKKNGVRRHLAGAIRPPAENKRFRKLNRLFFSPFVGLFA